MVASVTSVQEQAKVGHCLQLSSELEKCILRLQNTESKYSLIITDEVRL